MEQLPGSSTGPTGVIGAQRLETERLIQRGRLGALALASGLALSFGSERSLEITVAVGLLLVTAIGNAVVLRAPRQDATIVRVGWVSFVADTVVCAVAVAAVRDDPVDPIIAVTFMVGIEAAVRWGARGALGGGLVAGTIAVVWAMETYAAIGRHLPPTSVVFRGLSVVIVAMPVGLAVDRLHRQRDLTSRVFERSNDAIVVADRTGRILSANAAAAALLGARAPDDLADEPFEDRFGPLLGIADLAALRRAPEEPHVAPVQDASGAQRWFAVSADRDDDLHLTVVTARDITQQRLREQDLTHQAWHDTLTGLPNRAALRAHLEQLTERHDVGLVFLDLDGFKLVNDVHGHLVGDALLVEVAERLRQVTRETDAAYRWAGDEFCLVVIPADEDLLRAIVERVHHAFAAPFLVDGTQLVVTASVGMAMGRAGDDEESLLHRADAQMYAARSARRDEPVP